VAPVVRWYGGGGVEGSAAGRRRLPVGVRDEQGVLAFDRVDRRHAGLYTCVASSQQGTIDVTIRVDVIGIYVFSKSRDARRFDTVQCRPVLC